MRRSSRILNVARGLPRVRELTRCSCRFLVQFSSFNRFALLRMTCHQPQVTVGLVWLHMRYSDVLAGEGLLGTLPWMFLRSTSFLPRSLKEQWCREECSESPLLGLRRDHSKIHFFSELFASSKEKRLRKVYFDHRSFPSLLTAILQRWQYGVLHIISLLTKTWY